MGVWAIYWLILSQGDAIAKTFLFLSSTEWSLQNNKSDPSSYAGPRRTHMLAVYIMIYCVYNNMLYFERRASRWPSYFSTLAWHQEENFKEIVLITAYLVFVEPSRSMFSNVYVLNSELENLTVNSQVNISNW